MLCPNCSTTPNTQCSLCRGQGIVTRETIASLSPDDLYLFAQELWVKYRAEVESREGMTTAVNDMLVFG